MQVEAGSSPARFGYEAVDTVADGPAVAVAREVGELDAVVSEDGMQPLGIAAIRTSRTVTAVARSACG